MMARALATRCTLAAGLAACGAPAPARSTTPVPVSPPPAASARTASPPPPASAVDCDTAGRDGTALHSEGKLVEAAALLEGAVARCGNGHALHDALGLVRSSQHRLDEAAIEFIAELKDPKATPEVFAHLYEIYGQLGPPRQAEIAGLGGNQDAPIKVPEIRFEYLWVEAFGCVGGHGKVSMQALVNTKAGPVDLLSYDCPDGKRHETYFDYSDDPTEKALRKELEKAK